jgi:aspartyl-tRNA(Asn)/glutamyl-tRNA(Gln) amidotransferase subunit B
MKPELEIIIGLETHMELSTARKLFCFCANDPFGSEPNQHTCPICMGFPGALPVINEEAVNKAVRLSVALDFQVNEKSVFARKNYFYPDLPMGFQISMYKEPLAENGDVKLIMEDGTEKVIGIERLHLENDAGKLTHVDGGTLLDFNRAGSPLVEIVSKPDIRSADEAYAYAKELQAIARAVDASDADMEQGKMRFDASVSLRPKGEDKLYPRAEIKNLNSFKSLRNAINYEAKRQSDLWEKGEVPEQEMTVGWIDDKQKTVFMRWKETADDYRYFDEPDLPPLSVTEKDIAEAKKHIPELPSSRRARYIKEYDLEQSTANTLANPEIAEYFEKVLKNTKNFKVAANWIATIFVGKLNESGNSSNAIKIDPVELGKLANSVNEGSVSSTTAKEVLVIEDVWSGKISPNQYISEHNLSQEQDEGAIIDACKEAIKQLPDAVNDLKAGKEQAIGALMGAVMRSTRGKAPAAKVTEYLKKLINEG